jgi:transcriptional regulator with XRE-family HTH domain
MKDINKFVAERIKNLRKQKGVSQELLSFDCDMDRSYLAHLESKPRNISISNLEKICDVLGITIRDFFDKY